MTSITIIICLSVIAIALIIANAKEKIEEKRINKIQEEREKSRKQKEELLERLTKELIESFPKREKEKENEHSK